ncbi:oxygen-independent coproporphyrinogen III oxidase [Marinomonas mediterranea]|uniref:oxygen-independent coproporphyrinogen III oxidase n=1 Tax=Marinomonas mediterranea TaxID=119864 RepID=UPI002349EEB1|nr:oxygen-independent coproporphyrinogen III oxidase [Marinomonas mediterranea]WCN09382.1 oxygen-independent coproporphyrinogen III oxidase [Marinomonas mediterranea]
MLWDSNLIQKYNISGPRYTSYPTAPQFTGDVSKMELIGRMMEGSNLPISLYFHIPFCAHLCYYCACNKVVTKKYDKGAEYVELLAEEMRLRALMLDRDRKVTQLHLGGGTPTFLSVDNMRTLFKHVEENFNLVKDDSQDFSIEIDPREVDNAQLVLLKEFGFNRVSLGIQDFDPVVQKAIHREQSRELVAKVLDDVRTAGFKSVNFDLIYGLPHQTTTSFMQTIDSVIELNPERISVFNYAHLPSRFAAQRRINDEDLPSADEKMSILKESINALVRAGYRYIGMDHFAKPDDPLAVAQDNHELQRNFQGYTTNANTDLIAFGVSAISKIDGTYVQNHSDLALYQNSVENGQLAIMKGYISTRDDMIRHDVIMKLMCDFCLDSREISTKYRLNFMHYFTKEIEGLEQLKKDGIVRIDRETDHIIITVTAVGRLLVRRVCMLFDQHLNKQTTFSKII